MQRWRVAQARSDRLVLLRHKLQKAPQAYKTVSTIEICVVNRARSFTPQELILPAYELANK